jgi:hypothetical protein
MKPIYPNTSITNYERTQGPFGTVQTMYRKGCRASPHTQDTKSGVLWEQGKGVLQMTQKSLPRNARNARTNRENSRGSDGKFAPGAGSHRGKLSIVIHSGVSKVVIVKGCSNCGHKLQAHKVECQTILTRFKCPVCGQSIENTNQNRCTVCHMLCADSETYNSHKWGGCPNAGLLYPFKGHLGYRDENVKEKVGP